MVILTCHLCVSHMACHIRRFPPPPRTALLHVAMWHVILAPFVGPVTLPVTCNGEPLPVTGNTFVTGCVEPRPLVQTGPQGDSLPACGTRRRRRPSRLERARRREAHWTVVASPLPALRGAAKSQEPSFSAAAKYVVDRNNSIAAHFLATTSFGYSSSSWSARARALVSTPGTSRRAE